MITTLEIPSLEFSIRYSMIVKYVTNILAFKKQNHMNINDLFQR